MGAPFPQWELLASLDWPPPPSPRQTSPTILGGSAIVGLGSSPGAPAASAQDLRAIAASRRTESKARGDLWALRKAIEREKLRSVAPFPFFGRAMRFQDKFSALQITDDGRFSFAVVHEAENTAERAGSAAGTAGGRRIITYEGVFILSQEVDSFAYAGPAPPANSGSGGGDEKEKAAASSRTDEGLPRVAATEGRALVCHTIEERGGRTKLESVDKGNFRFAITVSPFFEPATATVQALVQPRSPGRPPPRRRQMPYVGTGAAPKRGIATPSARDLGELKPHLARVEAGLRDLKLSAAGLLESADTATLQSASVAAAAPGTSALQKVRRRPRPKFSQSTTSLQDGLGLNTSFSATSPSSCASPASFGKTGGPARSSFMKSGGSVHTASAPLLPSMSSVSRSPADGGAPTTVADWKDYYANRAKTLLGTAN